MNKPPAYPEAINFSQLYPALVADGTSPSAPTDESLNVGGSSNHTHAAAATTNGNARPTPASVNASTPQLGVPPAYDGYAYYGPVFLPPGMVYIPGSNPDSVGAAYMVSGVDGQPSNVTQGAFPVEGIFVNPNCSCPAVEDRGRSRNPCFMPQRTSGILYYISPEELRHRRCVSYCSLVILLLVMIPLLMFLFRMIRYHPYF
ncbi:hypothetical protein AAVH_12061 [Aphelenchoides avenae]|nr:hypothetical protein AAVH_12061 [Aphelenchus avenae]